MNYDDISTWTALRNPGISAGTEVRHVQSVSSPSSLPRKSST
jgi:hypothetical protein